jgi:hypothetical protein
LRKGDVSGRAARCARAGPYETFTARRSLFTKKLLAHPYIGFNQGDAAMNQATLHTETTSPVRDFAVAMRKRWHAAAQAIKSFAAEMIIIGVMALAVLVLKLVHIAVSNPAVANALTSGRLFF